MDSGDLQSGNRRSRETHAEQGIESGSSPAATPAWVHDPLPDPFPPCRIKEFNHFTAPTVHPGFSGTLTLEKINLGPTSMLLRPGLSIAQLIIEEERGDQAEARRLWRMVLDACPDDPEAMSRGKA
jgi:hypothetical protein